MASQKPKMARQHPSKRTREAAPRKYQVVKYFTRRHLIECARLGLKWDYNRQVSEKVRELPEANYPVIRTLVHQHRHFQPCEPHIRCGVGGPNGLIAFIDVPMWYYDKLPQRRIPANLKAA